MKGLFIPGITTEMFRNGCLESIEELITEGEIYDIDYQQPCDDCISRQAVLETIEDCNSDGLKGIFCSYNDGKRFEKYIMELPSVTPKEKTGKWINDWEMGMSKCSECGETYLWEDYKGTANFHFCPNCGAKMEGDG